MQKNQTVIHTIPPVFDRHSRILLLGTMPSPKSREVGFYYGHPQNRFWKVLATLFSCAIPNTNAARTEFLLTRRIALWDVLASCEIRGADDGSIKNPVVNDIGKILQAAGIRAIFTTGSKAYRIYNRYCLPQTGVHAKALPSTSPANCRFYTFEKLLEAYRVILQYI